MKPRAEQVQAAARDAAEIERLRRIFKERGVIWRDGKVVVVPPEEIDV